MSTPIDLTPLNNAVLRLSEGLERYRRDITDTQIRSANEHGLLLGDWPAWRKYRDMRARTSHAYDEKIALEVVEGIAPFLEEARHLAAQIGRRLGR